MTIQRIEYGSLADSEVINSNFSELESDISSVGSSISTLQSNISSVNSTRLYELSEGTACFPVLFLSSIAEISERTRILAAPRLFTSSIFKHV